MRIVVGLDGSESSHLALGLVAGMPWPAGSRIGLVAAYDVPLVWPQGGVGTVGDWTTDIERILQDQAQEQLLAASAELDGRGWTVERRAVSGRAASAIQAAADAMDADLIVMGSRGRGPIGAMLLGSVSAEVTAGARQSVLVVRARRVTRVVVATDGSDFAATIPTVLAGWGVFRGLPARAVSVAPTDSPLFELMVNLYALGDDFPSRQRDELLAQHRDHATVMARRLSEIGIPAEPELRSGDAADQIIAAANESRADLIVTGSRSLRGVDRFLVGSVARNVLLHAEASVLIVRAREDSAEGMPSEPVGSATAS